MLLLILLIVLIFIAPFFFLILEFLFANWVLAIIFGVFILVLFFALKYIFSKGGKDAFHGTPS